MRKLTIAALAVLSVTALFAGQIVVREVQMRNGAGEWRHMVASDGLFRIVSAQTLATNGTITASVRLADGVSYDVGTAVAGSTNVFAGIPAGAFVQRGQSVVFSSTSTNAAHDAAIQLFLEKVND